MDGCNTIPNYNIPGQTIPHYCVTHKTPTMIDVKNKTCETIGCNKQPAFNIPGEIKGRFCFEHKELSMVDVKSKRCEIVGCDISPNYNNPGESRGRFCTTHKELYMVDVKSKRCEVDGCNTIPNYNIHGETKGRFCTIHKEENMINVKSKQCEVDGCNKLPSYNIPGEKTGRFCTNHKESNMIDVNHKICEIKECMIIVRYGLLGKPPTHCSTHKQKGMITSPTKPCQTTSCKQLGTHESSGTRFCEEHAPPNAENLGIATCTSCGLDDILTNGKCNTCDPTIQKIRQHAKENRIKDILTAAGFKFIHDKMLEGPSCGRERPDFQIDCGSHFVYIEVDEHQHQSYACECEQTRMINLVHARGMPVRWIRYNPDCYELIKGQRYVKQEQREKKLIEYVTYAINHTPQEDGVISNVLYLFYDEYDTTKQTWHTLL